MGVKLSQTLDNLFDGVSRKPHNQRLPSQCQEQINMLSLHRQALSRRPPLQYIAKAMTATTGYATAFVEEIRRSESEQYVMLIINGDLKVFDINTGAEITVSFPNAKAYLTGATDGFRAVTVGEDTVITNRSVVAQKGSSTAAAWAREALIVVRQGDYDTKYTVELDGNPFTHATPTTGRDEIATDYIAGQLVAALEASPPVNNAFTFTVYGSTIHVVHKLLADFTIATRDGLGDSALLAVKGSVQRFTDLPVKAKPGFTVQIMGDDSTAFDNYFVQYQENNTPGQSGTWQEVPEPGSLVDFDAATLPHRLSYKGKFLESTANGAAPVPATVREGTHVGGGAIVTGQIIGLNAANTYPPGSAVKITLSSVAAGVDVFTYTNATSAYATAATMSAGLKALVEAHADWVTGAISSTEFECWNTPTDDEFACTPAIVYDTTTHFANSTLTMVAAEHVGRTIYNTTDGSSAVIASNTVVSLISAALAGGADNRFDPGDVCYIGGTGIYFIFQEIPWDDRGAGTLETVPYPSFIDHTITHVFDHSGRLGFLSGPNVILSRAGKFYNLFSQTATQDLVTDPIDVRSATAGSPAFDSAVNWNGALLLMSDLGQYILEGKPALTPQTVSITRISEYQSSSALPPVVLGPSAFFMSLRGDEPIMWDLRIRGAEQTAAADDVTLHVPGYIRGAPLQIIADDSQGLVFLRTDDDRQVLHVYASQYEGPNRAQAAWSKWEMSDASEIVSITARRGRLTMLTKDANGLWLQTALLDPASNPAAPFHVYLDRLVTQDTTGVTVGEAGGITTWTLPYSIGSTVADLKVVLLTADGAEELSTIRPGPNDRVAVIGSYSASDVFIGVCYESRFEPSRIYRRDQNGAPDLRGKLRISWLTVHFVDTKELTVSVSDESNYWILDGSVQLDGSVRVLTTREGSVSATLETTDEYRISIGLASERASIALVTQSSSPMNIAAVSWEGEAHDIRGGKY